MRTEYEATFPNIDKDQMRQRLQGCQAQLVKPEFRQSRCVFDLPRGREIPGGWLRLRDEGDRVTLTLKVVKQQTIEGQQELELQVDNFQLAETMLGMLGCRKRAYQENLREIWTLDEVTVTLDTWPFLEPFVEIEGRCERSVQAAAEKLALPYENALFCSIDRLYARQYGISPEVIQREIPLLMFTCENPILRFIK
uniref:CYTH domain-containing protein n=1 Tax=Thermosporothrix sp. COM3 TaxID=2490863 RepID=A0A455SFE8_9CHLR|nr:hypothetical protein KTC_09810 [Thermosporothrix sp. COM3]